MSSVTPSPTPTLNSQRIYSYTPSTSAHSTPSSSSPHSTSKKLPGNNSQEKKTPAVSELFNKPIKTQINDILKNKKPESSPKDNFTRPENEKTERINEEIKPIENINSINLDIDIKNKIEKIFNNYTNDKDNRKFIKIYFESLFEYEDKKKMPKLLDCFVEHLIKYIKSSKSERQAAKNVLFRLLNLTLAIESFLKSLSDKNEDFHKELAEIPGCECIEVIKQLLSTIVIEKNKQSLIEGEKNTSIEFKLEDINAQTISRIMSHNFYMLDTRSRVITQENKNKLYIPSNIPNLIMYSFCTISSRNTVEKTSDYFASKEIHDAAPDAHLTNENQLGIGVGFAIVGAVFYALFRNKSRVDAAADMMKAAYTTYQEGLFKAHIDFCSQKNNSNSTISTINDFTPEAEKPLSDTQLETLAEYVDKYTPSKYWVRNQSSLLNEYKQSTARKLSGQVSPVEVEPKEENNKSKYAKYDKYQFKLSIDGARILEDLLNNPSSNSNVLLTELENLTDLFKQSPLTRNKEIINYALGYIYTRIENKHNVNLSGTGRFGMQISSIKDAAVVQLKEFLNTYVFEKNSRGTFYTLLLEKIKKEEGSLEEKFQKIEKLNELWQNILPDPENEETIKHFSPAYTLLLKFQNKLTQGKAKNTKELENTTKLEKKEDAYLESNIEDYHTKDPEIVMSEFISEIKKVANTLDRDEAIRALHAFLILGEKSGLPSKTKQHLTQEFHNAVRLYEKGPLANLNKHRQTFLHNFGIAAMFYQGANTQVITQMINNETSAEFSNSDPLASELTGFASYSWLSGMIVCMTAITSGIGLSHTKIVKTYENVLQIMNTFYKDKASKEAKPENLHSKIEEVLSFIQNKNENELSRLFLENFSNSSVAGNSPKAANEAKKIKNLFSKLKEYKLIDKILIDNYVTDVKGKKRSLLQALMHKLTPEAFDKFLYEYYEIPESRINDFKGYLKAHYNNGHDRNNSIITNHDIENKTPAYYAALINFYKAKLKGSTYKDGILLACAYELKLVLVKIKNNSNETIKNNYDECKTLYDEFIKDHKNTYSILKELQRVNGRIVAIYQTFWRMTNWGGWGVIRNTVLSAFIFKTIFALIAGAITIYAAWPAIVTIVVIFAAWRLVSHLMSISMFNYKLIGNTDQTEFLLKHSKLEQNNITLEEIKNEFKKYLKEKNEIDRKVKLETLAKVLDTNNTFSSLISNISNDFENTMTTLIKNGETSERTKLRYTILLLNYFKDEDYAQAQIINSLKESHVLREYKTWAQTKNWSNTFAAGAVSSLGTLVSVAVSAAFPGAALLPIGFKILLGLTLSMTSASANAVSNYWGQGSWDKKERFRTKKEIEKEYGVEITSLPTDKDSREDQRKKKENHRRVESSSDNINRDPEALAIM